MSVKINNEVIETMLYFWQASSEGEKVGEDFIRGIANRPEMQMIYSDDFGEEEVRKVLSAISNRERLNDVSKEAKKFWNNNMWMMEDLGVVDMMVQPVKHLNLDDMDSDKTLIFIPGHFDEYYVKDDIILINFFKIMVDIFGGTGEVTMDKEPFEEHIRKIVREN
ncbi:hypothetical protein [uncultured Anaerococcus sp.]|uniref:TDE2712 family protein n=1 Tax=uncultured Anaerococcus sp. TaxID=293428 RepID=UPI0026392705|nr:hypothetical protein [uncultured Anaerococcus sp.]